MNIPKSFRSLGINKFILPLFLLVGWHEVVAQTSESVTNTLNKEVDNTYISRIKRTFQERYDYQRDDIPDYFKRLMRSIDPNKNQQSILLDPSFSEDEYKKIKILLNELGISDELLHIQRLPSIPPDWEWKIYDFFSWHDLKNIWAIQYTSNGRQYYLHDNSDGTNNPMNKTMLVSLIGEIPANKLLSEPWVSIEK